MLAHVCHALHVPNRFNRANLEEIKGYGVLALKSYVLSQKDRRRRAQLLFAWAFGGERGLLVPAANLDRDPHPVGRATNSLRRSSGFFPGHLKPVYLSRNQ